MVGNSRGNFRLHRFTRSEKVAKSFSAATFLTRTVYTIFLWAQSRQGVKTSMSTSADILWHQSNTPYGNNVDITMSQWVMTLPTHSYAMKGVCLNTADHHRSPDSLLLGPVDDLITYIRSPKIRKVAQCWRI